MSAAPLNLMHDTAECGGTVQACGRIFPAYLCEACGWIPAAEVAERGADLVVPTLGVQLDLLALVVQ